MVSEYCFLNAFIIILSKIDGGVERRSGSHKNLGDCFLKEE